MKDFAPAPFPSREEAGRQLGAELQRRGWASGAPIVLALPRGGVVVAAPVAEALGAPLDVLTVRKLGAPGHEELAMGALASGDARVLNDDVIRSLSVDEAQIERVAAREHTELQRRERAYRGDRAPLDLEGRPALLVDDGIATGATMRVAVQAARARGATRVAVAAPTGAADSVARLRGEADDVVVLRQPHPFGGVGGSYRDFPQVEDAEVRELLDGSGRRA